MQNNTNLIKVKVISLEKVSKNLFILTLDYKPVFTAGQVIRLSVSHNIPPRLYSIASGINDDNIKILFDVKESGVLTPKLAELSKSNSVYVSKPFGEFTSVDNSAIWIATGTGIAPFLSMMLSGNYKNKTLIHGARLKSSFYFQDKFMNLLGDNYIRCCSGEKGDGLIEGRVTEFIEKNNSLPIDSLYYLCGQAEMIVETRDILIQKGVPFSNIIAEIYF